jgi:hypothetical protein
VVPRFITTNLQHWLHALLGKKMAKAGIEGIAKLERERDRLQATFETIRFEKSTLGRDWQDKVNALHQQLANVQASYHSPTIIDSPITDAPVGHEANGGHLPDFLISVKGSEKIQAPFIQQVPGASIVLGTLGGPSNLTFAHGLYALPFSGVD